MELRHLRVLIAVADELHFGRAAGRLNLTQPSVSGQIRQLEKELGVRLLDRSARRVALTEAGRMLLDDAHRIVKQADAASSSMRAWRDRNGVRVRVGYVPDVFPRALPVALSRLAGSAGYPLVELTTGTSYDLISQVHDGSLDAAIVTLPAPVRKLRVLPFAHEHAVVAVRLGVPDRRESEVPLALAARGTVLTQSRRLNPGFYDAVVAAFKEAGVPSPLQEVEGASVEQLLLRVVAGAGMALVPESVADRIRVPGVGFRHLTPRSSVRCQLAAVSMIATRGEPVVNFLAALAPPAQAPGASLGQPQRYPDADRVQLDASVGPAHQCERMADVEPPSHRGASPGRPNRRRRRP